MASLPVLDTTTSDNRFGAKCNFMNPGFKKKLQGRTERPLCLFLIWSIK